MASETPSPPQTPPRLLSLDAYRGFVMFLMMAEVLMLSTVANNFQGAQPWKLLAEQQTHVTWTGCSLHDLIQPSFSFLVGAALPFSLAARLAKGQSLLWMSLHALWRSVLLVLLGVALRSVNQPQTRWTFEDTLSQIGFGYPFLFGLALLPRKWWWIALGVILVGYWGVFALDGPPPDDFDYVAVKVPPKWEHHKTGFESRWNLNSNVAARFDRWFLNQWPRKQGDEFRGNSGGYSTLNFVPTLATMILGLIAGGWLRDSMQVGMRLLVLLAASGVAFSLGLGVAALGLCPIVKKIWTPSWVLFSGGWCLALLAFFHVVLDAVNLWRWAYPLLVIGANSIFAYILAHDPFTPIIRSFFRTHFGAEWMNVFDPRLGPLVQGVVVLVVQWLVLFWMYRRKVFVKI